MNFETVLDTAQLFRYVRPTGGPDGVYLLVQLVWDMRLIGSACEDFGFEQTLVCRLIQPEISEVSCLERIKRLVPDTLGRHISVELLMEVPGPYPRWLPS